MAFTNHWNKFCNFWFFLRYVQKLGQSDQNVPNICLFTESYHFVWNHIFGYRKTGTLGLLHEGTDSGDFCMPIINGSKPVQWSVSYRIPVCLFTDSYHFVQNYMFGYRKTGTLGLLHEGTDSWDFCMPTINRSKPVQWCVSYPIPVLFVYRYPINSHIDKQTCLFLKMWFFYPYVSILYISITQVVHILFKLNYIHS